MDARRKCPALPLGCQLLLLIQEQLQTPQELHWLYQGMGGTKKTQLYARSVGAFEGGDAGIHHTVSDAERPQILETLKTQLIERLRRETSSPNPRRTPYLSRPPIHLYRYQQHSPRRGRYKVPSTYQRHHGLIPSPSRLIWDRISKEALSDHSYTSVSIPNLADLSVTAINGIPADPAVHARQYIIEISGNGSIITEVTPEKNILSSSRAKTRTLY